MDKRNNIFSIGAMVCGLGALFVLSASWFGFMLMTFAIFAVGLAFLSASGGRINLETMAKMSIADFFKSAAELVKKFDVPSMLGFACGSAAVVLAVIFAVISGLNTLITYGFTLSL